MSCIIYMMSCNSTIHATCLLALTTYKYSELQVFSTIQKLSCKASCKTPFFIVFGCFECCNFDVMSHESLLFIYKVPYFYLNH
jgi:hypothetical protein